jgi:hypothetical protein
VALEVAAVENDRYVLEVVFELVAEEVPGADLQYPETRVPLLRVYGPT